MNTDSLHLTIDYLASSGIVLSVEQKASMQTSLVVVKAQQRLEKIEFWGKILGIRNDYFICQGVGKDELKDRKLLYSLDCVKWGIALSPSEEIRQKCVLIKGRFTGDPAHVYEHSEKGGPDAEEGEENTDTITVKEEDRLVVTIESITKDVAVVPRGAYLRTSLGQVHVNRSFSGLSVAESTRLSSYYHFREPILLQEKSILDKADLDKALDFFDSIDLDIPQNGSWSVQAERGSGIVVMRSLHWLGFTFFHVPNTPTHGYCYVGTGEKNLDLPFML